MKIPKSHVVRIAQPIPEAHHVHKARKHSGKKAPNNVAEGDSNFVSRRQKWLPKRDTLNKSNV